MEEAGPGGGAVCMGAVAGLSRFDVCKSEAVT